MAAFGADPISPSSTEEYFHWPYSGAKIPNDESGRIVGETIGKGLSQLGHVADKAIETHIDDALHADIDPKMEQRNQDLAATISYVKDKTVTDEDGNPINADDLLKKPKSEQSPVALQNLEKIANNIRQGREHGVYNDVQFRAEMDLLAKRYRTQFPGFRDFIDEKIRGAEGSTANQYAQAQIQTLNDLLAQRDRNKDKTDNFLRQHNDLPGVEERRQKWEANPTPENERDAMTWTADQRVQDTTLRRAGELLNVDEKDRQAAIRNYIPVATQNIANINKNAYETIIPGMDPKSPVSTPHRAMDYAIKVHTGQIPQDPNVPDPAQIMQAGKDAWDTNFESYLDSIGNKKTGETVRIILGQEQANKLRQEHQAIWDARINAVNTGDKRMADHLDNMMKVKTDTAKLAVWNNPAYEGIRRFATLNSILGNGPAGKVLENIGITDLSAEVQQFAQDKAIDLSTTSGKSLAATIAETKAKLATSSTPSPETKAQVAKITKYYVDSSVAILKNPSPDPRMKDVQFQTAENIFSPGNAGVINEFSDDKYDRQNRLNPGKYYIAYQYGSPEMINQMWNLGQENKPTWINYKTTMENWIGRTLIRSSIASLNDLKTSPYLSIGTDENGHLVSREVPQEALDQRFPHEGRPDVRTLPYETQARRNVAQRDIYDPIAAARAQYKAGMAISQINSVTEILRNIAIKEKKDPAAYITTTLHNFGYDEDKPGTLGDQVFKALNTSQSFENRFNVNKGATKPKE